MTSASLPFGKPASISLDLRKTKCPLNFVKAKLALEKLAISEVLEVLLLTTGDSALNVPNSFRQEGQSVAVLPADVDDETLQVLHIKRLV
ncbi:MAG: sulfurtransferase TusA family protein [Candidatus Melainabacteria bacterium]|nr:sulfurtransferase TusA family protein [Candidatus Melainabacteria bacterium]